MWKTTIVIWTNCDPGHVEISDLAREAETGDAYCSKFHTEQIADHQADPDWDGTDFFDSVKAEADDGC